MEPVTPCAYSGLAKSRASDSSTAAWSALTCEGNCDSRSGLKSGNSPTPGNTVTVTCDGAKRAAARSSAELIDAARRLPDRPRILMTPNAKAQGTRPAEGKLNV